MQGKGDKDRTKQFQKYWKNYERIFARKASKYEKDIKKNKENK